MKKVTAGILVTDIAPKAGPGLYGVYADRSTGQMRVTKGASSTVFALPNERVVVVAAAHTLTSADDGTTVVVDSTTSRIVTLPSAAVANQVFRVFVKTPAGSAAGHSVAPATGDTIYAKGITPAASKSLINTQATGAMGDAVTLRSDGNGNWFASIEGGTWARQG
jgi:hypothetical protein